MDHADLRTVTVGDRQLIISLHEIGKCFRGYFYRIPLFCGGITQGIVSQRYDNSFFAHKITSLYVFS